MDNDQTEALIDWTRNIAAVTESQRDAIEKMAALITDLNNRVMVLECGSPSMAELERVKNERDIRS